MGESKDFLQNLEILKKNFKIEEEKLLEEINKIRPELKREEKQYGIHATTYYMFDNKEHNEWIVSCMENDLKVRQEKIYELSSQISNIWKKIEKLRSELDRELDIEIRKPLNRVSDIRTEKKSDQEIDKKNDGEDFMQRS